MFCWPINTRDASRDRAKMDAEISLPRAAPPRRVRDARFLQHTRNGRLAIVEAYPAFSQILHAFVRRFLMRPMRALYRVTAATGSPPDTAIAPPLPMPFDNATAARRPRSGARGSHCRAHFTHNAELDDD